MLTDEITQIVNLIERGASEVISLTDAQFRQLSDILRSFECLTSSSKIRFVAAEDLLYKQNVESALTLEYLKRDPTSDASIFSIRANDYVGVVTVSNLVISIQPKIDLKHFLYIVSQGTKWNILKRNELIEVGKTHNNFLEIVATWFLHEVSQLIPDLLLQDYRPIEVYTPTIRGSVFPRQTTEALLFGNLSVFNRFEVFDIDTPQNRLLKHSLRLIGKFRTLPDGILNRARSLYSSLGEVGPYQTSDLRAPTDRRYQSMGFAPSLELARRIVTASGYESSNSGIPARPFLMKTYDLIEMGIQKIFAKDLTNAYQVLKTSIQYKVAKRANPDLVFSLRDSSTVIATGDVKYKIDTSWVDERSDLYQAAYFATAANVQLGSTIYFSSDHREPDSTERPGNVHLQQFFWNCDKSVNPEDSRRILVDEVRNWLQIK